MGKSAAEIDRRVRKTADMMKLTPLLRASRWSFRAASSSAARWPARWSRTRGWCCWTSRSPTSTTSCARNCGSRSPKIFEASGAIFVYATTEPEEALLLGGNTATLWEGRVTQFGPTPRSTASRSMPRPRGCSATRR
jgi:glycerol transport system ATP-binding protein